MEPRITTALILFGLSVLTGILFFSLKKSVNVKRIILHLGLVVAVFGLLGLVGMMGMALPQRNYLALQLIFLFLGGMHIWLLYHWHSWSQKEKVLSEMLFTLTVTFLGGAVFLLVFQLLHRNGYEGPLAGALLAFPIPFFAHKVLILLVAIPSKIYKTWHYTDHLILPDIMPGESIKVRFRINRSMYDSDYAKFTIRAPMLMDFGSLFHSFLADYNEKNPHHMIHPNTREAPFCWFFYVKRGWWKKKVIDPDKTVYANRLSDDITIDVKRIFLEDLNY